MSLTVGKTRDYELTETEPCRKAKNYLLFLGLLLVLLLVCYGNSFYGEWHFDDTHNILDNPGVHLKDLSLKGIQYSFYFRGEVSRPLSYLSFALNYYIGGLDTYGYHVVNFVIHYLASIFLFLLILKTLRLPLLRERYGANAWEISMLATVLWAINPVQVLAVSYIVQRMASMAGLFYIAAMYFYVRGRTAASLRHRTLYFVLTALSAVIAFGCKETAAMLPVSLFFYDLFLIQGADSEAVRRNLKLALIPFVIVVCLAVLYTDLPSILDSYRIRSYTLAERLLTEPRVLVFYVSLLLYPINSRLALLYDFAVSKSFIEPWTTLPAIAILIGATVYAFAAARKTPLIAYCILFFLLNHLIEGSFIPVELIYEHRNYIPSMLFFVPVAVFIWRMLDYFAYNRVIRWLAVTGIVLVIFSQGHTVHMRNEVLKTDTGLWIDNILKYPKLSRPHNNLGINFTKQGLVEAGIGEYILALELDNYENLNMRGRTETNIGNYYYNEGQDDRALEHYLNAIRICSTYANPYVGVAQINLKKGNLDAANDYIRKGLRYDPYTVEYRELFCLILLKRGDLKNAVLEASRVLQRDPDRVAPRLIMAEVLWQKGRRDRAIIQIKDIVRKYPLYVPAYVYLIDMCDVKTDKAAVESAVASILYLKGERKLEDYVRTAGGTRFTSIHTVDTGKVLSIIRRTLVSEGERINPASAERKNSQSVSR
ncbi:MAG TPA: tetratricopeptide repeat protein [Syntrophales bacterium]|nr:tetratricopeptide repeat protein [Syntrophales bacterium]